MSILLYRSIIYIHVVSAIAAIGPFFLLFLTLKKLQTAKEENIQAYLDTFKHAIWIVKHSGHVLVISGVLLVMNGPWTWGTSWLVMTIVILLASSLFLARAFTPTLRKYDKQQMTKNDLVKKLTQTVWIYLILLLLMLWFMVVKPNLW